MKSTTFVITFEIFTNVFGVYQLLKKNNEEMKETKILFIYTI